MSKILWIDDDYQMLKGLMRPLERAGHEFDAVRTVTLALEKLNTCLLYELAVVDILLPLGEPESIQTAIPECIRSSTGKYTGEALIYHMRFDLDLQIPIVVLSVLANESSLRSRLESCEISDFLPKGSLSPAKVKETIERVLDEFDPERAVILNLRSKRAERREIGLIKARHMETTSRLCGVLMELIGSESDPKLRRLAMSVLENYMTNRKQDTLFNDEGKSVATEDLLLVKHDVFFSHNSTDKLTVEDLAHRLTKVGIQPWLDKWNLIPGEPWQEAIEEALDACQTVAVFLGPKGIGPWENEEMRSALETRVRNNARRVIPVLLPGAPDPQDRPLPRFLSRLTWVDFRNGLDDEETLHRLVSGIRGVAPGSPHTTTK